jgi:hypothetical protein
MKQKTLYGLFIIALLSTSAVCSYATDKKTVSGKGCYKYGDNDTPASAKEAAVSLAKRNAIENYKVYVQSVSAVENGQLKQDIVQSLSEGCLHNLEIIEEKETNRKICISVKGEVIPDEVDNMIDVKILSSSLSVNGSHNVEKISDGIIDWDDRIIRVRGFGAANKSFPKSVWKKSAEEAAIVDAQAKLVELIDGFEIQSKTFVKNYQISKDEKIKEIKGKLRRVEKVGKTIYPTDDTAEVVVQIDLSDVL